MSVTEDSAQSSRDDQLDVAVEVPPDKESIENAVDEPLIKVDKKINRFILPTFLFEFLVLFALAVLAYHLRFTDIFSPTERAYFTKDHSLMRPIPSGADMDWQNVVNIVFMVTPVIILAIGETFLSLLWRRRRRTTRASCTTCRIPLFLTRLVRFSGTFLLGICATSITVDLIKLKTSIHRPYFLTLCRPDMSTVGPLNDTHCSNDDAKVLRYARLSFPSHCAAIYGYSAFYTMVYLHSIGSTVIFRPFLILAVGGASLAFSFERVSTDNNHWYDVFIGYSIGTIVSLYLAVGVLMKFYERRPILDLEEYDEIGHLGTNPWRWTASATFSDSQKISIKNSLVNGKMKNKKEKVTSSAFQKDLHRRLENISRKASVDNLDGDDV